jgi:PHD/YefM family antitoxin component YafN of YafNO toxin-antitoxin module
MNTIAAQEVKRRGLAAVDAMVGSGPVMVLKHNQPAYVIMGARQYRDLVNDLDGTYAERVAESLADLRAGRVRTFRTAGALMKDLRKRGGR